MALIFPMAEEGGEAWAPPPFKIFPPLSYFLYIKIIYIYIYKMLLIPPPPQKQKKKILAQLVLKCRQDAITFKHSQVFKINILRDSKSQYSKKPHLY